MFDGDMTIQNLVDYIENELSGGKICKYYAMLYKFLDWKWDNGRGKMFVPNADDILEAFTDLARDALGDIDEDEYDEDDFTISSGGLFLRGNKCPGFWDIELGFEDSVNV